MTCGITCIKEFRTNGFSSYSLLAVQNPFQNNGILSTLHDFLGYKTFWRRVIEGMRRVRARVVLTMVLVPRGWWMNAGVWTGSGDIGRGRWGSYSFDTARGPVVMLGSVAWYRRKSTFVVWRRWLSDVLRTGTPDVP